MVTTFSRARKQRIDALVNSDDEGIVAAEGRLVAAAQSRRCSGSAR